MLSDLKIRWARAEGNIVIEPFNLFHLGPNSYDCTLGDFFYRESSSNSDIYVDSEDSIKSMWDGPFDTMDCGEHIPVRAGETVLAHTNEIIGGRNGYLGMMHCKSTVARMGLSVCRCAGVGDVGFINKWTMELSNHTRRDIYLQRGMKICQIIFIYVGETLNEYTGNYQHGLWKPEHMLPQRSSLIPSQAGPENIR